MKKLTTAILFFCLFSGYYSAAQSQETVKNYIEQYKEIAMAEMIRSGVPASITLAQGIHESAAGTSNLVMRSNNHFGIKCKAEWRGEWVSHDDDAKGECFRKYNDPFESYRDHSDFLRTRSPYISLFKLDPTDYEGWAYGLKKAGYATNPKYPQILIKLIRDYNLDAYTLLALERQKSGDVQWAKAEKPKKAEAATITTKPKKLYPSGIFTINNTKVIFVQAGTSFIKIADEHNLSLSRLFDFNDLQPQDIAADDMLIFLQRKRKVGAEEFHMVEAGETVHQIAQQQGIRLESLMEYNSLARNMQPAAGEKLYLSEKAPAAPRLSLVQEIKELFAASKEAIKGQQETLYHTHIVQPKETLYSIAKQYNADVNEIMDLNALKSAEIKTGQQLKINKKQQNGNQGSR